MLFLPSPFICMFFNGTTKIIHHPVPPPNKMFLSLPFCTSVLCHINALNLAPPDLNPLFALANHFFFLPQRIYRKISMFPSSFPSSYQQQKKKVLSALSSQKGTSAKCVSFQVISTAVFFFSSLHIPGLNIAKPSNFTLSIQEGQ